jgi:isopenicillin N synthase-like dioxygenase
MKKVRSQAEYFFTLSPEIKNNIHLRNSIHFRGYSAMDEEITNEVPDHKETMDFAVHE